MNKTISKEDFSVNEHMEDLRERMRILRKNILLTFFSFSNLFLSFLLIIENDRKINIDILEANKTANREEIRRLREESKELRAKLAQLQRVCLISFTFPSFIFFFI